MNEIPISDHIAIYILTWDAQKWASAGVQSLLLAGGATQKLADWYKEGFKKCYVIKPYHVWYQIKLRGLSHRMVFLPTSDHWAPVVRDKKC
jgi:hypothetical protein